MLPHYQDATSGTSDGPFWWGGLSAAPVLRKPGSIPAVELLNIFAKHKVFKTVKAYSHGSFAETRSADCEVGSSGKLTQQPNAFTAFLRICDLKRRNGS